MIKIFFFFIYFSTAIAVLSTTIVCLSILKKSSLRDKSSGIDMTSIVSQIGICKTASIIFTIVEWFLFSCEKKAVCLEGYAKLSVTCSRIGIVWIIYAFVCIIINILLTMRKVDAKLIANVGKFRKSSFVMGALYIVFAFILNV